MKRRGQKVNILAVLAILLIVIFVVFLGTFLLRRVREGANPITVSNAVNKPTTNPGANNAPGTTIDIRLLKKGEGRDTYYSVLNKLVGIPMDISSTFWTFIDGAEDGAKIICGSTELEFKNGQLNVLPLEPDGCHKGQKKIDGKCQSPIKCPTGFINNDGYGPCVLKKPKAVKPVKGPASNNGVMISFETDPKELATRKAFTPAQREEFNKTIDPNNPWYDCLEQYWKIIDDGRDPAKSICKSVVAAITKGTLSTTTEVAQTTQGIMNDAGQVSAQLASTSQKLTPAGHVNIQGKISPSKKIVNGLIQGAGG